MSRDEAFEGADYDFVIHENSDGKAELPDKYSGGGDMVIRQKGITETHQGRTVQIHSTEENDYLKDEMGFYEVEVYKHGEKDQSDLVKVVKNESNEGGG